MTALRSLIVSAVALLLVTISSLAAAEPLELTLQKREARRNSPDEFSIRLSDERWAPEQTALIVCDVWDTHHCKNAALRVEELVPRLADFVNAARSRGVTIIHAPSDCMDFYQGHPARLRAMNTPKAEKLPDQIENWCYQIPAEEAAEYPLDQTDGGCDDDAEEHAAWQASLAPRLVDREWPWVREHAGISIDSDADFISCYGDEIWSILEQHGVQNVMLAGVHTNMCVLGRPFGLRRLSENGKHVVLIRDLTDTMYNPQRAPYVNHFRGTDLIVEYIEKYVCSTITSDQLLGGAPFHFKADQRPRVVIVSAEEEYETETTLAAFARDHLADENHVTVLEAEPDNPNSIPGLQRLANADVLLLSVRRRALPAEQLQAVRDYVAAGKPVIGIRTASHAFSLRGGAPPAGFVTWEEFDAQVFGGNYHGHYGNSLPSMIVANESLAEPWTDLTGAHFPAGGSLYQTSPLHQNAVVLLQGQVSGHPQEPVAWTFLRADGGASFYTSLGHPDDFDRPEFQKLLMDAIHWAAASTVHTATE